jgi:uncharacterized protein (TIGR03437 family)
MNSAANPAPRGSIVSLYITGGGLTDTGTADGQVNDKPGRLLLPVAAAIGEQSAEVTYGGPAPGLLAGIAQINVRIPENSTSGAAIPVYVIVDDLRSQHGVTLAIR